MTSGPPKIPIHSFEDVIYHDFNVIVYTPYYKMMLGQSEPGTPKHRVYNTLRQNGKGAIEVEVSEARRQAIEDPKTLIFASPADGRMTEPLYPLQMEDASYMLLTLGLQKDSEFLQAFNYYLLKAFEHGILKKIHRKYHMRRYVNEQFGMLEPQPLGLNNVIFPFTCLGVGICVALALAAMEFLEVRIGIRMKDIKRHRLLPHPSATSPRSRRRRRRAWAVIADTPNGS